jgi:hypothetical protein
LDAREEQSIDAFVAMKRWYDLRDDVADVVRDCGEVLAHASRHHFDFLTDSGVVEVYPSHGCALPNAELCCSIGGGLPADPRNKAAQSAWEQQPSAISWRTPDCVGVKVHPSDIRGDCINGIIGAIHRHDDALEFGQVRHEEQAAFMACAHANVSEGPGEPGI